ncbi:Putative low molecular weight protein-tyrosine-phosphatase [Usitatibacter rugosus]|uniref:protein-tyrosine-phosphatase n=1 Tax=Usitatibacter rugosus TaxID=2732067 RepID=A0A6M4GXC4_9PROT|nr:low molecular weight protein-tyrosine-phosphatase [Usitatibacter rugosus]QJR11144.1 Putative low molecular weight protein-tyrosine-phosphatase [Usitatibacter rugosus]
MGVSVLVVCTGNICRSPTGEGVLRAKAKERGLDKAVHVASAGTHDYHIGDAPDARSMRHAIKRGYDLSAQRAQQVSEEHFEKYDYILAMDRSHLRILKALAPKGSRAKIGLYLEMSKSWKGEDVPDPYYGGPEGFETVLDMVEEAAEGWLDVMAAEIDPRAFRLDGAR